MLIRHVALVSQTKKVTFAALAKAAAAIQKQAVRDFAPIWEVRATVSAFERLGDVPTDYWPVMLRDDIGIDAGGVHLDRNGQPYALVKWSSDWSLTTSHEVLEMLADPFGNRLNAGQSPKPGQGRVNFLVEVCDPSEAAAFAYAVNGITVSDFYTPEYFDPVKSPAVRYSFTSQITEPRQVLKGGYLSWVVPGSNEWWQERWFKTAKPTFVSLGVQESQGSLRSMIDRLTNPPEPRQARARAVLALASKTVSGEEEADSAAELRAADLSEQIAARHREG